MTPEERAAKIVGHDELLASLNPATKDFLRSWIAETIELAEAAAEARERERCAKLCESLAQAESHEGDLPRLSGFYSSAEAIRASTQGAT